MSETTQPVDKGAEQIVLGGCMSELWSDEVLNKAVEQVAPGDFYYRAHRVIYQAILDLRRRGDPTQPVAVTGHLRDKDVLPEVGGAAYISELSTMMVTSTSTDYYIRQVLEKARRRQMIQTAIEITEMAQNGTDDFDTLANDAQQRIIAATSLDTRSDWTPIAEMSRMRMDELAEMREAAQDNPDVIWGIPSGYPKLDELTGGWQKGDLIVLGARPSMGKSAICTDFGLFAASHHGSRVGLYSMEMPSRQLWDRMAARLARINLQHMRMGRITDDRDWDKLRGHADNLGDLSIWFKHSGGPRWETLREQIRQGVTRHGMDLVVVDYLQKISGDRYEAVTETAAGLKDLAMELNIPIIAPAQLSRNLEHRTDKQPRLADLKESGEIEQSADIVMFLYRPDYYKDAEDRPDDQYAVLTIDKQRNGPLGQVPLMFKSQWAAFELYSGAAYNGANRGKEPVA